MSVLRSRILWLRNIQDLLAENPTQPQKAYAGLISQSSSTGTHTAKKGYTHTVYTVAHCRKGSTHIFHRWLDPEFELTLVVEKPKHHRADLVRVGV